jgi:hypothetical protein
VVIVVIGAIPPQILPPLLPIVKEGKASGKTGLQIPGAASASKEEDKNITIVRRYLFNYMVALK